VVLEELFGQMMKNRLVLEYHLERHRQRSGKATTPEKFIFDLFVNAYLRNADEVEDLILVPITINYDKVYEGEVFPYELLGEEKPKESLFKFMKHILISKERQGRVIIKYCKPISLKKQIQSFCEESKISEASIYKYDLNVDNVEKV
jgi:glycerone phosphate O-acyltransferase/fatty acyl-CoA reductase